MFVRIGWNVNSSKNNDGVIIICVGEDEKVLLVVGTVALDFGLGLCARSRKYVQ